MTTGVFAGLWDVVSCSNKEKYICKKPAEGVQVTTVPPTTPALSCASGWTPAAKRNVCFKVGGQTELICEICAILSTVHKTQHIFLFHNKLYKQTRKFRKTWQEALDFCKAIGGDLMSIHSTQDLNNAPYVNLTACICQNLCYATQPFK